MAMRNAARYVSRRLSSGVRNLIEEEKSAENMYIKIKKSEHEKLQKLASKAETLSNEVHNLRKELQSLSEECEKLATANKSLMVCPPILSCQLLWYTTLMHDFPVFLQEDRSSSPMFGGYAFHVGVLLGIPYLSYIYSREAKAEQVRQLRRNSQF
ncbi:hypothetical protein BVC80_1831g277 [Macleaya cordata]|uniref:Uncharacterized protein n=1 Tax=Macleaya cordata TaxID=56857 RepID=A0A200R7L1_MACCD|nr:hypothetical protein BVC80_1831g277 [Macleaya cordata]